MSFCLRNTLDGKDKDMIYTLIYAPEKFTGCFFAGPSNLMIKMQQLYHECLNELYDHNISDDDQHIYLRCFFKEPKLFNLYLDETKWPKALCYFENAEFIKNKLMHFSHQEYNTDIYTNIETIQKQIETCSDLFNRPNSDMEYIKIEDNTYLPPLYDNYLQNFYKCKTKNYCFIHSCCLEKDKTYKLDYLINDLVKSNCINSLDKIYINNIGKPLDNFYIESFKDMNDMNKAKFETNNYSLNIYLQEAATINKMISFSKQNPNNNILYIHTKGIRFDINDSKQTDWINMMTHFLLYNSNKCIEKLNDCYDSVGCNYHDRTGEHKKHYSGNFWWSKTNHLAKLEYINELDNPRKVVEFHLFSIDHKCFEIHKSGINHYFENYPKEKYKDINV
jgi:hypothetical protein